MNRIDRIQKRLFDMVFSIIGLAVLWPIFLVAIPVARYSTGASGLFCQTRIGRMGIPFTVYKLRTMCPKSSNRSTVTLENDHRITRAGAVLRRTKLDELPQLWNVFLGDMSLVGPRPDVAGYADKLKGAERRLLVLRPGITGPASIKYRHEEILLNRVAEPEQYNAKVIYPDKIRLNLKYLDNWTIARDVCLILATLRIIKHSDDLKLVLPEGNSV